MLDGASTILDAARGVSRVLRESGIRGAIVGGIAVGLHGHVRATLDVDVYAPAPIERFAAALRAAGCAFDARRREHRWAGIPVHIVTDEPTGRAPSRVCDIAGIQTVGLADLINMKLRSGMESVLRAQDVADVIALIRVHRLSGGFVPRIDRAMRSEFRRLLSAVRRGR